VTLRATANKNKIAFLAGAFLVLAAGSPARALTIQATFDSSIVNAPNAADIENTINFATNEISSLFSNPGTVTILFKYASGNFLGESNSSFYFDTYATVTSELQANLSANPQNAVLATALNNLSSGNDANGARDIEATSAEFRLALGDNTATPCFDASGTFVSGCNSVFDGVITLSSSQPIDFTRPVPAYDGTNLGYDGVRVAEHEIDEVLGGGGSGSMLGSPDQATRYGILDLYRYSAPGTPSYTGSGIATSYFSIDGGNTNIVGFNQNHNGDYADWGPNITACDGGGAGGPGFVQDAFSCNNVQADVTTSSPEYTMLQAIGYDPVSGGGSSVTWDCTTNPDSVAHSGAVSATKTTSCTQIVLGANTFTGGTTIVAGTLQLGNGDTQGSIVGNVADGSALAFDHSDTVTFSGVISGSGSVQQMGTGTTILTGSNTYVGGTTISAGTLQLGNGGTTGAISGNVVDNGAFVLDRSDTVTFAGAISGTGSLTQAGSGFAVLTGNNTYSGVTTIANGALVLGANGTTGSIAGNVVDNNVFYIDRSDQYVFGGTISGIGIFVQSGSGKTILTGTNTYLGPTAIWAGALQLGNGGTTGSIIGNVTDNAALIFGRSDNVVFSGLISGTGAVQQAGPGKTTLTAASTYTGGTTISTGTLQIGNGGTTGSIVGNITDNGALVFDRSDNVTVSGNIAGTGSLTQGGGGNSFLFLTGNDSYTGGTTIANGALVLGANGTTGSITGNIVDNNVFYIDRSNTYTFAGVISGPGVFVQAGSGTTILTGTNTYMGNTSIQNGTLQLGNGGTTGSITGSVIDAGTLAFDRSDNVTFAGVVSGAGRLSQIGTGRVILSGTNSYSGGTKVASGTLEAATSSAFGAGNVALNGTSPTLLLDNGVNLSNEIDINVSSFIDVNGSDSATISGALVGSAPFEKDGTGTLTLNHDNSATYSGNISFHGHLVAGVSGAFGTGTVTDLGSVIQLMDGVTDATATNLVDNLQIIQDGGSATISGVISQTGGPWGVTKTGVGTLFLTAANTYTGATFVNAGTLVVNGSVAGLVTVNATGTLKGTGTMGSLSVASAGTVAPGNSIGTLHVAGNVSFGANSIYQVEANAAGQSDEIIAGGTATLSGGIVQVLAQPGAYAPVTNYTILTAAGGVTGTFAGATSNTVILAPSLSYKPGEVDLTLTFHPLSSFAGTTNQANVASAIQGNFSGTLFNAVDALTPGQLPAAFNAASGEIHASVRSALLQNTTTLRQTVLERLHDAEASGSSFWAHPFGNWGSIDSDGNAAQLNTNFSGITIGADTSVADGLRLGLDGGYGQVQGFAQQRGSSLTSDSVHLGVYGGYGDGPFSLKAGVLGSWGNVRTTRVVLFPGFLDKDTAKQSARTTEAFAEAAYDFGLEGIDLAPFINGGWSEASTGAFSEAGGVAALLGLHASSDDTFMTLGARLSTDLQLANGADILPNVSVGWMHSFHGLTPSRLLTFEATGQSFTVLGVPLDQDEAVIDAGFAFHPLPAVSVNVGYNGILSQRVSDNGVHANLSWKF
jgi:outer membrane autotransporter protein